MEKSYVGGLVFCTGNNNKKFKWTLHRQGQQFSEMDGLESNAPYD